MKYTLLTTFFFTIAVSTTFAQRFFPAEIYTLDGQTIKGLIKNQGKQENCASIQFKRSPSSEITKYTATELQGYAIEDKAVYRAAKVNLAGESADFTRNVFLQTLVDGGTDLYRLDYDVSASDAPFLQYQDVFYFLKKQDESAVMLIVEGGYKNQIKTYFERFCQEDVQTVNDNYLYGDIGLAKIIKNYNEVCSNQVTEILISLAGKRKKFKLLGGIGVQQTEVLGNSPRFSDFTFENGTGLNLHIALQAPIVQRLSFQIGVDYQKMTSSGSGELIVNEFYFNEGEVLDLSSEIDFQFVRVPVNLKYSILPKKFSPYIYGGIHFGLGIGNKVSIEKAAPILGNGDNILTTQIDEEPFGITTLANEDFGWQAGIGLDYQLSDKIGLYIAYQFQQGKNNVDNDSSNLLFENKLQGILLGVAF